MVNFVYNFEEIKVSKTIISKIEELLNLITEKEGIEYDCSVDVTFVDNEEIKEINKEIRKIDKATDVLSFPLISFPEGKVFNEVYTEENLTDDLFYEDNLMLGDVVISLETAEKQAEYFGHSFEREVIFLFTHSLLHLLGYDHMNEEDSDRMSAKEELYLNEVGVYRE